MTQNVDPLAAALDRVARIEAFAKNDRFSDADKLSNIAILAREAHSDLLAASLGAE